MSKTEPYKYTTSTFKIVTDGDQDVLEVKAPFQLEGQNRKRVFMRRLMDVLLRTEYEVAALSDEAVEAEWKKIEQTIGKTTNITPYYP